MHAILTTRHDVRLRLHQLRLAGELAEIRAADLRFTERETRLGGTRQAVFQGLRRALGTAAALRHQAGLEFVVAPVPDLDGESVRRLDGRHAVSVFPFLAGRSYKFGAYPDERLRGQALELIAALHQLASDC